MRLELKRSARNRCSSLRCCRGSFILFDATSITIGNRRLVGPPRDNIYWTIFIANRVPQFYVVVSRRRTSKNLLRKVNSVLLPCFKPRYAIPPAIRDTLSSMKDSRRTLMPTAEILVLRSRLSILSPYEIYPDRHLRATFLPIVFKFIRTLHTFYRFQRSFLSKKKNYSRLRKKEIVTRDCIVACGKNY